MKRTPECTKNIRNIITELIASAVVELNTHVKHDAVGSLSRGVGLSGLNQLLHSWNVRHDNPLHNIIAERSEVELFPDVAAVALFNGVGFVFSFEGGEHVGRFPVVRDHGLVSSRVLVNEPIGFNSGVKVEVNVKDGDVLFIKENLRIDFGSQAIAEVLVIAANFGASWVSSWKTNKAWVSQCA